MTDSFTISETFPVPPDILYRAWLSTEDHSAFTGSPAVIDPRVGGAFTAWDGYITGVTLELDPPNRILQSWRTTEFPEGSPDSRLEILFERRETGTALTLKHSGIPEGQAEAYKEGWKEFYFEPMQEYFEK
jgi:activator of HSP90 ATPase